jgi:hypothetical protein
MDTPPRVTIKMIRWNLFRHYAVDALDVISGEPGEDATGIILRNPHGNTLYQLRQVVIPGDHQDFSVSGSEIT